MGYRPLTRFIVQLDGAPFGLFKVRERAKNGELIITPYSQKYATHSSGTRKVKEQHISVHECNEGRDTLVTFKQLFDDGHARSDAAYVHDTADTLLQPIFFRRIGITEASKKRILRIRKKDKVHILDEVDSKKNVIYLCLGVAKRMSVEIGPEHDANTNVFHFRRLSLLVTLSFMHLPSPPDGDLIGFATSPTVINGSVQNEAFRVQRKSMSEEEYISNYILGRERLKILFHARYQQKLALLLPDMAYLAHRFFSKPFEKNP